MEETRDYTAEVDALRALWPEVTEVPEEVAQRSAQGENLVAAYAVWRSEEHLKEVEALRAENEQLRRSASAPVRGMKGAVKETLSDFERGLDAM